MAAYMHIIPNRKRKVYYEVRNHFDFKTDTELYERYRFQRDSVQYISDLVVDDLPAYENGCGRPVEPIVQVGCFLRYVASNCFQQVLGDTFNISQSTVNRSIWNVCDALLLHLNEFIKWPNGNEVNNHKRHFLSKFGLPNVIGALDGTHIRITEPSLDGNSFINLKFYPSINVMGYVTVHGVGGLRICKRSQSNSFVVISTKRICSAKNCL